MARNDGRRKFAAIFNPVVFFAFITAGAAYIVVAKFFGLAPFLVTSVPVGLLVLYSAIVQFLPFARLRADQAGDNVYYLGFLYTLTSLGASLYQFHSDAPVEEILNNFGVAVATTIAGVALRVAFNQMSIDPLDVEHIARLEMAEAARKMRRELDATVVELAHFRRGTEQQVKEGFDHVRETMTGVSGAILARFEEMTVKAAEPFRTSSESSSATLASLADALGNTLDAAARRLAEENDKLATQSAAVAAALQTTSENLAKMQGPDKVIEVSMKPISDELATAVREFAKRLEGAESAAQTRGEAAAEEQRQHTQTLRTLAAQFESSTRSLAEAAEKVAARDEAFVQAMQKVDGAVRKVDEGAHSHAAAEQALRAASVEAATGAAALQSVATKFSAFLDGLRRQPADVRSPGLDAATIHQHESENDRSGAGASL
ncbi:hypothetical protein SAMN05216548_1273 [Faunimonas pinastri]|uniref:Uncharacterized protein n=1 Tax=Faunimonas pinastri TaxID=1855383 RepID=A0A1H9QD13_9HYPH|nr:hypothetical protein [Faunimonas pinastri]SER58055.1 hypothetical protein SAMN05216548_1273 [Faunimonas pinastri]